MRKKENINTKGSFTRMCSACNMRFHKNSMLRVVRKPDGSVHIDLNGKESGRGAYVCKNLQCIKKLQSIKRLSRLLKTEVSDEIYEELIKCISFIPEQEDS
ncbi:MAG: hypothetical protein K0S55_33 [Clostridia bacterium]|nr:hypothetical protein [Clostridia bacterium]